MKGNNSSRRTTGAEVEELIVTQFVDRIEKPKKQLFIVINALFQEPALYTRIMAAYQLEPPFGDMVPLPR